MSSGTERAWIKSSYSGSSGDSCVEVAAVTGAVRVRDSKHAGGPQLHVPAAAWASFVDYAAHHTRAGTR